MRKNDIIFAIICGLAVAWIASDFFQKYALIFLFVLPVLSIIGLRIVDLVGEKILFVHQAGKYFLVGSFSAVVDIRVFQFSTWIAAFFIILSPAIFKTISFSVATVLRYLGNKYWTFEKKGKDGIKKEAIQFFAVTLAGLVLNVGIFLYFTKIMGTQFHMQEKVWTESSIIFAAIGAAVWNFLACKFLVFKK